LKAIKTIFALFLMAVYSGAISKNCQHAEVLIFPQAAPVQFWLTGCDTYNETIPKGVHYKCFCQPWKCTDVIPVVFRDTFTNVVPIENIVAITLPDLDEWQSSALDPDDIDWTEGATPSLDLPYGSGFFHSSTSEYLYVDYAFEEGKEYSITIDFTMIDNPGAGTSPIKSGTVYIMDDAFNVIFAGISGSSDSTINFTANASTSRISLRVSRASGTKTSDVSVSVQSASGTRTDITYDYPDPSNYEVVIYNEAGGEVDRIELDAFLIPEGLFYYHTAYINLLELGICDEQIRFEIEDLTASPDTVVAKSDCQNITDSDHNPTILIEYSSPKNFNGLVFEGISPDQVLNIRVPAIFYHEDNPQEDEVAELSNKVIKLNSQVTAKRLLDTDFMPHYMHTKIILVLSMPLVLIDGLYWTKQDSYDKDDGNKRWPVKRATCWLTQRDFLERQSL
jgi:hypothetical protein